MDGMQGRTVRTSRRSRVAGDGDEDEDEDVAAATISWSGVEVGCGVGRHVLIYLLCSP